MSEPIRSISEGTFVLGDTNGLTFEAGPGISVSQPSEGTVRIANDETVLWSGACLSQGGAAVTLAEPASNFEKIEIYAVPNPQPGAFDFPQVFTYPGDNTNGAYMCPFMINTDLKGKFAVGIWTITNGTSFNLVAAGQTDSYPSVNWNDSYGGVVKIVGINRKENA